ARFSDLKSEISNLIGMAVNISKQLHGWLESLKNSEIKGVKFLTEKEKKRFENRREQDNFDQEMAEFKERHAEWLIRRQSDPNAKL
ncbi:MAG TPA: hypothetical protein VK918_04840, partial [Pyrinomonadaceae bacterium]|nr:hypothetical protein [Pyrinomonadaceae bacterium]